MSSLDSSIYLQGSYIRIASNNDIYTSNLANITSDNSLRNSCDRVESIQRIIDDPFISLDSTKLICKPCISDIIRKIEQCCKYEMQQNQQLQTFLKNKYSIQDEESIISFNDSNQYDEDILAIEEECNKLKNQENELKYILGNRNNTISQLKSTVIGFQLNEINLLDCYEEDQLNQSISSILDFIESSKLELKLLQKLNTNLS